MQRTLLMVDTTHASHATRLAAMQAASAALVSYTLTDTVLPLPAGDADVADYSLIDCLVPNASRTGSIAWAHRDNIGDDYFIMELSSDAVIPLMAPGLLGRSGAPAQRFVRQAQTGGHGSGTGKTWKDAANGWGDATALGATLSRDTVYWTCGFNFAIRDGVAFASVNDMPAFPAGSGATMTWRMDYPLDPGMNFLGFTDRTGTSDVWTRPDAVNHPRVWKATFANPIGTAGIWLLPIDPTLSTTLIYRNHLFGSATSQAELEANALSVWQNGSDMWVHMPDDSDPTDKVARSGFGYNPADRYMDATTAKQDFDFVNCQFVGAHFTNSGGMGTGSGNKFPKARFLGGRYLFGASFKPHDACILGAEWGRSTDGEIPWDTSDRPAANDPDLQTVVSEHGSDRAVWDETARFIEIDSAKEGIYWAHAGLTNNPDNGKVSGALFRHIGEVHPEIAAKLNNPITYDDGDSHAIATQGGSFWTCEYFWIEKAGAAVVFYAIGDATSTQNIKDNVFQDFVIRDSHQKFLAGAGQQGIDLTGDNQNGERTDGSGILTGNIIRRGYIYNIVGNPSAAAGSPVAVYDGNGIHGFLPQVVDVSEVTIERCTNLINTGRALLTDATYADDPAYLDTQLKLRNCRLIVPLQYFWWHRTLNWTATSPNNLGYIDSDNNEFIYASDGNPASDTLFRMVSALQTFATWKINSKASPPGEAVSVYDPASSTAKEVV